MSRVDLRDALGRHAVDLGEGDGAVPHAQEVEDGDMLLRLRHRPVIRRDDQQHEIDAGDAAQHVADEALVPRHVDEADGARALDRQIGEAQIDGHAALLLLGQAVGIDAGQRLHQQRLAVIDMAGRGDDHAERVELPREQRLVLEAAQIEHQRIVLDAADHRHRQRAKFLRPAP